MVAVVCVTFCLVGSVSGWQSYTNTNFINAMTGDDSTLVLATNGGVVFLNQWPEPVMRAAVVNTDGLLRNTCLCVVADAQRNYWVGTDGGGLAVLAGETLDVKQYRPSEFAVRINTLLWDGTRLLAGTDQGLYVLETRGTPLDFDDDVVSRYTQTRVPGMLSDRVISLAMSDRYWIGTNLGVAAVDRDFASWTPYRQPLGDSVKAMAFWRDSLIVATEDGVALLGPSGFRSVFEFAAPTGVSDLEVADDRIYLATQVGLYESDAPEQSRFQVTLSEDSRAVLLNHAVWVGLGGPPQGGFGLRYQVSGQSWVAFSNPCIASDNVSDCAILDAGDFYLCHGGPITWIRPDGSVSVLFSVLPVPVQVRADSRGRLWFAHFAGDGGLAMFDPVSGSWETVQWGPQSERNIITAFGLDAADTKWVFGGGPSAVVVAVDSVGGQQVFEIPGLTGPPGGGYEFAFDSRGRAWLGLTAGLTMIDYAGTLADRSDDRYATFSSGLPSAEVRSVAVDGEDQVWVATPQGVALGSWDGDALSFRTFSTSNSGIVSNNVFRVRVDGSDRIWLLCEGGMSVYDQVTESWVTYTPQNSGLIANALGTVSFYTSLALNDNLGMALIGTQRGLSSFNYSTPAESTAGNILVFPNPCDLGEGQGVVVDGLTDDAFRVEARTLEGRWVADFRLQPAQHRAVWRPTGVASGLYLVLVRTPRGTHVEKVVVVGR